MRRLARALATGAAIVVAAVASAAPAGAETRTAVIELHRPEGLRAFARAVSDPGSARYRDYASVAELTRRFGAPASARRATARWVRAHGLRAVAAPGGGHLLARGDAAALRRAFGPAAGTDTADGHLAGAAGGHAAGGASTDVAVPAGLRGSVSAISLVAPTSLGRTAEAPARAAARRALPLQAPADPYNGLPQTTGSALRASGRPGGCAAAGAATGPYGRGFTPDQISTAYGFDRLHRSGLRGEGMRVALIEADGFLPRDLKTFAACFGLRLPPIRTAVVDRRRALPPGPETTLDLEVLIAQAPRLAGIDVQQMHSASSDVAGDLLAAVSAALRTRPRPDALSLSLDVCEAAIGAPGVPTGSIAAVRALDDLFALAAAAGVTTVVASGDAGSAGCLRESDSALPSVSFPSSSAWVTAVGGTNVRLDAANRIAREVTWNDTPAAIALFAEQGITAPPAEAVANASGGGRSLLFARPWWQRDAGLPGGARLVPDVSALAGLMPGWVTYCSNRACVDADEGGWSTSGGTSAATPLVAAALTLASQAARRRGQAPIGFANPLIYRLADGRQRSAVLRDVTVGATDVTAAVGRNYHGDRGVLGVYPAGPGYDLATGWGSLRLPGLTEAALAAGRRGESRSGSGR